MKGCNQTRMPYVGSSLFVCWLTVPRGLLVMICQHRFPACMLVTSSVATLSVRRVSPYQVSISSNHNIQLKPCSCRGVAECGDPPVQCSSESIVVFRLVCNPAPTFCKTHSTKLQVSDHGLVVQMFRSKISTVVISTNTGHLDVAVDHETLQP